jgi:hypothetical protein
MMRFILPLVIFLGLSVFLYKGLNLDPHEVPSPLIDKPAPTFSLPQLHQPNKTFGTDDRQGLAAECVGVVVRFLPRRASAIGRFIASKYRAGDWFGLQR